jgi:hypothetical protein
VVFDSAEEEVMERATEKESEGSSADNVSMYGEGHITYLHAKVLSAS